jgi:hypothetical protein
VRPTAVPDQGPRLEGVEVEGLRGRARAPPPGTT